MQLCPHFLFVTVGASLLWAARSVGGASLYSQAVLAESVLCQCFSEFIIFHCGQRSLSN